MTTPPPQIIQIPFEVPAEIYAQLLSGAVTLSGQKVRDAVTGNFLKHLKPASDVANVSKAAAQPGAQQATGWIKTITNKSGDFAKGFAQAAKNNPGKSALIAGGAAVGLAVTGAVVTKISQKRSAEKTIMEQRNSEIQEAARNLDSAIKEWLEAATQAALTEDIVNDLAAAYASYSEVTASTPAALNGFDVQRQDFYERFAKYTVKVAEANGVEFECPEEPSNVVNLAPYIACQQALFARGVGS